MDQGGKMRNALARVRAELAEVEAQLAAMDWIDVKDRIPEVGEWFIAEVSFGNQRELKARRFGKDFDVERPTFFGNATFFGLESMQRWRPLPPPPEGK